MIMDYMKWNRRASLLYALGAWTMLGYCAFKLRKTPSSTEEAAINEGTILEKHENTFTETTVIQRGRTVEYQTRLLNPFRSRNDSPPESKKHDEELE